MKLNLKKELEKQKRNSSIQFITSLSVLIIVISYFGILISNEKKEIDWIHINQNVTEKLNKMYINNSYEFAVCLKGEIKDNEIYINDFDIPKQEQFKTEVDFRCIGNYLGNLHSHPLSYERADNNFTENELELVNNLGIGEIKRKGKFYEIEVCKFSDTDVYNFAKGLFVIDGIICNKNEFRFISKKNPDSFIPILTR